MKIRDILSIKEFEPVVDLTWGFNINEHEKMLSKYIMTDELAETFVEILESFNMVRSKERIEKLNGDINSTAKRSHIISGQYGTGKSYFLLMMSIILEMKNSLLAEKLIEQFHKFPELQFQLKYIRDNKKYLVVRINGEAENEKEFLDIIQSNIIKTMEKEFGSVDFKYIYNSARENLEKIYSIYGDQIDNYLEENEETIEDIYACLSNHRREGLDKTAEIYKNIVGIKMPYEILGLEEFLDEANKELKKNGYNEIVIIFDEFSAYVTAAIENKKINITLGQIQDLFQRTFKSSQKNISFIASVHKDMNSIFEGYGLSLSSELEKIIGRVSMHTLKFEQGNELIKNSLMLDEIGFRPYYSKYKEFIDKMEEKYNLNFLDFYPLHPATVDYLTPISQIFAQKTRTTLGFVKEVVKEQFFSKEIESDNKLNLVTLNELFLNFEDAIESKNSEIINVYNQNTNGINENDEVLKYIRALTIAYSSSLSKTNTKAELTVEDLMDIYQIEDEEKIKNSLNQITNTNYSNIIVNNGAYRLIVGNSGVRIDKKISEEIDKVSAREIMKNILTKAESRIFIKKRYDLKYNLGLFPFNISLDSERLNIEELEERSLESLTQYSGRGKLIFIIPDFNEEYDKESLVEKYAVKFKEIDPNICLIFANDNFFVEDDLKEYGALLRLELNDKDIALNDEVRKILIKRRRKLEDKIRNKYLRKFNNLKNFTFVFGGGEIDSNLRSEMKFFEKLLFTYYNKFPREMTVENFNTRSGINGIIEISPDRGTGKFSKNNNSIGVKQLKTLLKPLDLVEFDEVVGAFEFKFKLPEENVSKNSKEIMDIILGDESLAKKYEILQSAPYGLSDKLVDLYLYVANKIGKIYLTINGKPVSLDHKTLEEVSKNPENCEIKRNEELEIPKEVENVWKTLNRLRIVKNSHSREFRADSSNDFDPFFTLKSELKVILDNLKARESILKEGKVKIKYLKLLNEKIKSLMNYLIKKEFFEEFIKLPSIFEKETFEENMKSFEEFINNLQLLNQKTVMKCNFASRIVPLLEEKISDLIGYGDLKEELKEVKNLLKKYRNDFLNIEVLDELNERTIALMNNYNQEFKSRHDIYREEYNRLKEKFMQKYRMRIEIISIFEELNFKNISSINDFKFELENMYTCEVEIIENEVAECSFCREKDLKKLEGKREGLLDLFNQYQKRVLGIFEMYDKELKSEDIKEILKNDENYKIIIFALRRVLNEETNGNEVSEIKMAISHIKRKINNILEERNEKPENNIEFNEMANELLLELQGLGVKYLSFEEVKEKFNLILKKYEEKDIHTTKI